jgi:hypothetical protein
VAIRLTPRLKYPFPDFLTDPWFDEITSFFLGVDGTNWAVTEDRNLFTTGGGTLTLDGAANTLTWTMPIYLQTFSVGISWRLEATTVTIFPGQIMWVQVDRRTLVENPATTRPVTAVMSNVLLTSDPQKLQDKIILGFRRGNKFYWRTGCVLADGVPSTCLEDGCCDTSGLADLMVYNETPATPPDGLAVNFTTVQAYEAGTLRVYQDGMRLQKGTDWIEINPTTYQFTTAPSVGMTIVVDYIKDTAGATFANLFVYNEVPTGLIDGINANYTTAFDYIANKIEIYLDGMRMQRGVDWVETGSDTFQFTTPPAVSQILLVDYLKLTP